MPRTWHPLMMPSGAAVPAACPMASSWPAQPLGCLPAHLVRDDVLALVTAVQVHRRGPGRGVTHPLHQLAEVRARVGREHVPGMAQVVEMHRREPGRRQGRYPEPAPEVGVPERPASGTGENEPVSPGRAKVITCAARPGMINSGIATIRTPASDFGGPNVNPPPSRSFSCRTTRTVRAWTSISARRSAASSPHRRLVNAASSTRVRYRSSVAAARA